MNRFINVQPSELKFPFQLNKLSTCWMELSSKTDINVAFKVKTTHPKKYCVRPNSGLISPGSSCVVKVSMQAQKDYPAPLPKDKFLVLSMIAPVGMNAEDITSELFRKEKGYDVEELKLRVVFVTADPPSPIAEVSEEDFSPEAHELQKSERNNYIMDLFDAATISIGESEDQFFKESNADREDEEELFLAAESSFESERKLSQDWDRVSKLIEERSFIKLENQELQYEAEMIRKRIYRSSSNHGVILFVVLACFLGIVVGYVIR
ncbi:vesicle-associated protein 1-3-like isoform X1 [Amaranthus tricolor]|uniref:vesicle-associated protein 1-3-like isoform X1 n=2 Tax=Amaranthus tricolor TaxID=29722 RepID=UPI00258AC23D|nr:vesicle-associated protein 1-3-like isoform X1 [Amaranthus tricolor]